MLKTTVRFDKKQYEAALEYYGLPKDYKRTFKQKTYIDTKGKEKSTLVSCKTEKESNQGLATWVQINPTFEDTALIVTRDGYTYPKKAANKDIQFIRNIPLDFEFPSDPSIAHYVGLHLAQYLVEQGLAEPGLPIEDSGAGCHIGLPLPAIETTKDTAENWNTAVSRIVKKYIQPEFDRIVNEVEIEMDLEGYDISRILSLPGTWRPHNPSKGDCAALQDGYLRRWLEPYDEEEYPTRKESAKLASLIREAFENPSAYAPGPQQQPIMQTPRTMPGNGKQTPPQWLDAYAAKNMSADRSGKFQALVNAAYIKFGEDIATDLKEQINHLSGEKYNGRLDTEFERSLASAKASAIFKDKPITTFPANPKEVTSEQLCSFYADDAGNGDAMFLLYGRDFIWCSARGWLRYTGTHWQLDEDAGEVKKCAVNALRRRRHAAVDLGMEGLVTASKASDKNVNGCLSRFKTLSKASIDQFDAHPDFLNCKNGVVNLRTGEVEPHNNSQRFTYCIPVPYEKSDYSVWLDYLNGVVGGGEEAINYLQLATGYAFTGHTNEEILFYLHGPTRSGKGTFSEEIMALLPRPLATMVDFNSFTAKREGDTSNFDLAPLKPSRVIFASESQRGQSLNPAKIKQLTGGDLVRCSHKHKDFFEYKPQFKMFMLSNHPVNGDPDDDALWGRVRVISFPNSYLGKEDKSKKTRLKEPDVLKGVLYWAIQGAIRWYALGSKGLQAPQSVVDETQRQRNELDYVQQWLDERGEDNPDGWVSNEEAVKSFSNWCKENNITYVKTRRSLTDSLKMKGYKIDKQKKVQGKNKKGIEGLYIYPEDV